MIIKTSYPFMKPPPSARLIRGHRSAQGLVGCWPFSAGGGLQVFDLSENGAVSTFIQQTHWVAGDSGSALSFDGVNDAVSIALNSILEQTLESQNITMIVRVSLTDIIGNQVIFGRGRSVAAADPGNIFIFVASDKFSVKIVADGEVTSADSTSLVVDRFYTVAATYDGVNQRLYVDGVQVDSDGQTGNMSDLTAATYPLAFGGSIASGVVRSDLNGRVAWGMVYNRVLSASEIAELYWRPFCMLERRARTALMSGYEVVIPPVGMAGAMTTNTGFWGW